MSTPYKMKGHTLPGPMQKKGEVNPFSAEYKRMTKSQRTAKYGEEYKKIGSGKKAINRENVATSLGKLDTKIKGALSNLDKTIKGPEGGSYLAVSKEGIKRTAGGNPKPSKSTSKIERNRFKPVTFKGEKGDPYSYRTTKSGGYEFSKDGTNFTKATNQKAIDAIGKIAPIKMKKKSSKGATFAAVEAGSYSDKKEVVSKTSPGPGWTKTKGTNIWAPPAKGMYMASFKEAKKRTAKVGYAEKKRTLTKNIKTKEDNLIQKQKKRQAKNIKPFQK